MSSPWYCIAYSHFFVHSCCVRFVLLRFVLIHRLALQRVSDYKSEFSCSLHVSPAYFVQFDILRCTHWHKKCVKMCSLIPTDAAARQCRIYFSFAALITNTHATSCGRYEWTYRQRMDIKQHSFSQHRWWLYWFSLR